MLTKEQAINLIKKLLSDRDHYPFWTDEMKDGYRHACREITEALGEAGAFLRSAQIDYRPPWPCDAGAITPGHWGDKNVYCTPRIFYDPRVARCMP